MKKLLAIAFLATALTGTSAMAQTFSTRITRQRANPQISRGQQTEGSVQRGVRLGSPLQMVNPAAPSEYGTGQEFVTYRLGFETGSNASFHTRDTARPVPTALRLYTISF